MSIKVIGAGLPRTGTNTLKDSLEKLGYTKTYHMKELLGHPENLHYWQTLEQTGTMDWDTLYKGFQASVDFPAYPWYKEHMKKYPDAKVILTVRPFNKWHDSITSTILQAGPKNILEKIIKLTIMIFNPRIRRLSLCVKFAKRMIFNVHFQGKIEDKAFAEKMFNQHIADVKAYVPADKLLVYDVSEGWGPLCKFLGVPEPAEPIAHLNKKENFKEMLGQIMKGNAA